MATKISRENCFELKQGSTKDSKYKYTYKNVLKFNENNSKIVTG